MKKFLLLLFLTTLSVTTAEANLLPSLDAPAWKSTGNAMVTPAQKDGSTALKSAAGKQEGGFWAREIALEEGNYILKFSYRTIKGRQFRVLAKHGNNTYGLLSHPLPPSKEWKDVEIRLKETIPGKRASIWFLGYGEFEISGAVLEKETENAAIYDPGLLPPLSEQSKWQFFGKTTSEFFDWQGNRAARFTVSASEGGIWTRNLTLQAATYRLKVTYRSPARRIRVIVKHGNNTYGLVNSYFPPAKEWKTVELTFTENLPGANASVWFTSTGQCEIAKVSLIKE
jgi:hypothetical protein